MSTKTGFAPASAIISPVAMNVNGEVITSSPRPMPYAISAISSVSVPLDAPMQCLAPTYSASLLSSSTAFGAENELSVVEHRLHAAVHGFANALVLSLEVDEVHATRMISAAADHPLSAVRQPLLLQHLVDRLVGEPIRALVAGHAGVALHPVPLDACRSISRSSACHRSTFFTGFLSAVRQSRAFHCGSHSRMPLRTYCESV